MARYVPQDYVLLENAYKEIIGDECEILDNDCKLTEEEREFLLLMNKYESFKQDNSEGKNKKLPKELLEFDAQMKLHEEVRKSMRMKLFQHQGLIEHCNMFIFQSGGFGVLDAKLIISKDEQYILNWQQILHLEHDDIMINSQGIISDYDESINSEIVKRGHIVVPKTALQKQSRKIFQEVNQYYKQGNWDPDLRIRPKTLSMNKHKGSGAPGRPTSWDHIVEPHFHERMENKLCETSVTKEAKYLSSWLKENHPDEPVIKPTTMENKIRDRYRSYKMSLDHT